MVHGLPNSERGWICFVNAAGARQVMRHSKFCGEISSSTANRPFSRGSQPPCGTVHAEHEFDLRHFKFCGATCGRTPAVGGSSGGSASGSWTYLSNSLYDGPTGRVQVQRGGAPQQAQAATSTAGVLNTLTSMQYFYSIFGSIPVGRLQSTIKGTFKAIG